MRSLRVLALFVTTLSSLTSGCDPGEHAILIDVRSQDDIEDLRVTVVSLDVTRPRDQTPWRPVSRTMEAIEMEPIRVAVELGGPAQVLVHVEGRNPAGELLVATRCYVLNGVIRDEVVLAGPLGVLDIDADGFIADPATVCRETDPAGGVRSCDAAADPYVCPDNRAADCAEGDPAINPGSPDVCQNGMDEDCSGSDAQCLDNDGDGSVECAPGQTTGCDCDDGNGDINPDANDVCLDGIDQDCSGTDACCDGDMDGFEACRCDPADPLCDIRITAPDCDDTNPAVNPTGVEQCDAIDNNCNGLVDGFEIDACRGDDLDGDGYPDCSRSSDPTCDRNDCDAGSHSGAREVCQNGLDEDQDDMTDEGCPGTDADADGVAPPGDCNDNDPLAYPHDASEAVVDLCGDGQANSCIPGEDTSCTSDADLDGYTEPPACEGNASISPLVPEVCDGTDNDCDGTTDEVLVPGATSGCITGGVVDFLSSFTDCGGCRMACDAATANVCNGGICDCTFDIAVAACSAGARPGCCNPDGCVDLDSDVRDCGACGRRCGLGETCVGGQCMCGSMSAASSTSEACPEPSGVTSEANVCCGATCVDVRTDGGNCGSCGFTCGPNTFCGSRACQCVAPDATHDYRDCDFNNNVSGSNGCETDVRVSNSHCGGCGAVCDPAHATGTCVGGSCNVGSCDAGFIDCTGANGCESSLTSPSTCGSCTAACGAGESCDSSFRCTCGGDVGTARGGRVCTTSETCCAATGGCVNTTNDNLNCGSCNNACGGNATCMSSSCTCNNQRLDCTAGSPYCETAYSTGNCGGCGAMCGFMEGCNTSGQCTCGATTGTMGAGAACAAGTGCCNSTSCSPLNTTTNCGSCGNACGGGQTCCTNACADLQTDEAHCGGCSGAGTTCGGTQSCCTGACRNWNGSNCGGCNVACGGNETCGTDGRCHCGGGPQSGVGGGEACPGSDVCCNTTAGTGDDVCATNMGACP